MNNEIKDIIEKLVKSEIQSYSIGRNIITVRCPVCGDSKHNKTKKRGCFLFDKDFPVYYCHNSGCEASNGISVIYFMKLYYPEYYKEYTKSVWHKKKMYKKEQNKDITVFSKRYKKSLEQHTNDNKKEQVTFSKPNIKELLNNNIDMKLFKKHTPEIINFIKERKIPEEHIDKLFYIENGRYFKKRIIIPFYDKNEIYYFQGRTIANEIPKYKNPVSNIKPFYNIFNINKEKPVIALEGPIDSFFIENSISLIGTNNSDSEKLQTLNINYIFDNDLAGKKKSIEYLKKGFNVFLWKKFLKDIAGNSFKANIKDINDLYKNDLIKDKLNYSDLKMYFTKNYNQRAML